MSQFTNEDYHIGKISYYSEVSAVGTYIHPLNAKCMHLGLLFQGANNVVHVHAIACCQVHMSGQC